MLPSPRLTAILIALFMLCSAIEAEVKKISNSECLECHDEKPAKYSAHRKVNCQSCHKDIVSEEHESSQPVKCIGCHKAARNFLLSDHGKAISAYKETVGLDSCKICHEKEAHKILDKNNINSRVHRTRIAETCASCHEKEEVMQKFVLKPHPLKSYEKTVHGKVFLEGDTDAATCTDCHGAHTNQRRFQPDSPLASHNVSKTCGKCHEDEMLDFEKSVHGISAARGFREAPLCITCHGEHDIQYVDEKESPAYKTSISRQCGECHASERIAKKFNFPLDRLNSYRNSFHGTMDRLGDQEVASCASCHDYHLILSADNTDSTVHPNNLAKTCGECHPGTGAYISIGNVHMDPTHVEGGIVYWVRKIWIWLIALTIGFMLFHNFIDYRKKWIEHYIKISQESVYPRLNLSERIQHMLLAFSFIGLAWTGFAITYPDSFIAYPFALLGNGLQIRWWAHRILAGILVLASVIHLYYAIFTEKGRHEILGMLPVKKDLSDLLGLILHNLGLRKEPPVFNRHNYIDKLEYLAVVWGTMVMAVTGGILLFDNIALKYLPMLAINVSSVIHKYEAILATLAIFIWHFYWVIFDPEEYPMRLSMLTGKLTKKTQKRMYGGDTVKQVRKKK